MSQTYNVLIIDDEVELGEILGSVFTRHGFNPTVMSNAGFAESKIHKDRFDAILSDIKMPFLDGIEILKSTRKSDTNKNTPFFILSAHVDKEAVSRIVKIGVQGVFIKPYNYDELVTKVRSVLDAKRDVTTIV